MAKGQSKLPYLQFYPSDWGGEDTLKFCSWEARYLWFEMILLCHKSPDRGFLLKPNGQPVTEEDLVELLSKATLERVRNCLFELESHGVFSRDRRKFIYSRKMVKGELRAKNLEAKKIDKSEIKSSKKGDKSDLASSANHGNIKQITHSDDRTLVLPETRDQRLDKKDKKNITKKDQVPCPEDVTPEVWRDHLVIRKAKNLPMTPTALKGMRKEAEKLGWTLQAALTRSCESGWAGFMAQWVLNTQSNNQRGNNQNGNPARPTRSELADRSVAEALAELERQDEEREARTNRLLCPPVL